MLRLKLFLLFTALVYGTGSGQNGLSLPQYDSVVKHRKLSLSPELALNQRFQEAKKAVQFSKELNIDSVRLRSNSIYSLLCIQTGNFQEFRSINQQSLKVASRARDSVALSIAHHNLGWFHHRNRKQNDSAYYHYSNAYKIAEQLALNSRQVDILINISEIQYLENDFIGSEESAIKAIKLAEQLPVNDFNRESLWLLYNRIGGGASTLKLFDKSLEYHRKALQMAKEMKDGLLLRLYSENNIAHLYKERGDYATAVQNYEAILAHESLFELNPSFYALVLDNLAYAQLLNGSQDFGELEQKFQRSYHLADSLQDPVNLLNVTVDLSKFYKTFGHQQKALDYAHQSYALAKEISSMDILLESMILLAELTPGEEGKNYLAQHIHMSDSLLLHERGIRNKFARIAFETDQIEMENKRIATEKMWWTISSLVLLMTTILVYVIITQRNRNNALRFKQVQQETNEEIYNLMLSQQEKVEVARAEEKKRISQELHDGVLGRLFGARLSLDSYNLKEGQEARQKRSHYISELNNIERDIRKISHDLNSDFMAGSKFMNVLSALIENQSEVYQLEHEFDFDELINWELLPNKYKIHLYRIIQETLHNIHKHAQATLVQIRFQLRGDDIHLSIKDNGVGFDTGKAKKGIGLKNIRSRLSEIGGKVEYFSQDGAGTEVLITIPNQT